MRCFHQFQTFKWFCLALGGLTAVACGPTPKRTSQKSDVGDVASLPEGGNTKFQVALSRENDLELPAKDGAVDTDPAPYPNGVVFRKVIQIQSFQEGGDERLRPPFLVFPPDVLGDDLVDGAHYSMRLNDERNRPGGPLDRHPVSREWDGGRWFVPFARLVDIEDADPSDLIRLSLDLHHQSGRTTTYEIDFRLRSPLPKLASVANPAYRKNGLYRMVKSKTLPEGWIIAEESYTNPSRTRDFRLWITMKGRLTVHSTLDHQFHRVVGDGTHSPRLVADRQLTLAIGAATPRGIRLTREDGSQTFEGFPAGGAASVLLKAGETIAIAWIVGPAPESSSCETLRNGLQELVWTETHGVCRGPRGDRDCYDLVRRRFASLPETWALTIVNISGPLERQAWLATRRATEEESLDLRESLSLETLDGSPLPAPRLGAARCQGLY